MTNPQFVEEQPLALVDVKDILEKIDKRDEELNYISNKVKEYLDQFVTLSANKRNDLYKQLVDLNLTRLKEEHIMKIIDFLPKSINELKIVLQAYPITMPKKDQEAIAKVVKGFI